MTIVSKVRVGDVVLYDDPRTGTLTPAMVLGIRSETPEGEPSREVADLKIFGWRSEDWTRGAQRGVGPGTWIQRDDAEQPVQEGDPDQ